MTREKAAHSPVPGFTTEQVQHIFNLIETPKEGYEKLLGNVRWLFNSGASCHMIRIYEVLENVRSTNSVVVGQQDRNQVLANKVWTAKLRPKLTLRNFLFIPKLTNNFISTINSIRSQILL